MQMMQNRRRFLTTLSSAGVAGLIGARNSFAEEALPETTRLRLIQVPSICQAGQFTAEDLFRREGFTDVHHIKKPGPQWIETALASGEADICMHFNVRLIMRVEAGDPIVILAGGHLGCFELFGTDRVQAIRDLKGKTVAVPEQDTARPAFIAAIAAYVGLDPRKDINWVTQPPVESMRQLVEGKIDAFLGFPPQPQQLRAMKAKSVHVVINSMADRPWSQYFCCMVAGNREFVKKHPVATKRALRAILNASDRVDREPEKTARFLVDGGFTENYDYALEALTEMNMAFTAWREYDPEDTIRFYALRLREAGMIKSSPNKIITDGTDWRFFNELKRELKG
jgi:NitT/TauT family transport system substrate-binding protein